MFKSNLDKPLQNVLGLLRELRDAVVHGLLGLFHLKIEILNQILNDENKNLIFVEMIKMIAYI